MSVELKTAKKKRRALQNETNLTALVSNIILFRSLYIKNTPQSSSFPSVLSRFSSSSLHLSRIKFFHIGLSGNNFGRRKRPEM